MTAIESIILVNENDEIIGSCEKIQAHREGLLHRAFSILLYCKQADRFEFLLQKRALHKYHSAGLWSNTCCSHPHMSESILDAGKRRLMQELGIQADLQEIGHFIYRAELENDLIEHEFDHVLMGEIKKETAIHPNPEEIADIKWVSSFELNQLLQTHPNQFTAWLKPVANIADAFLKANLKSNLD